MWRARFWYNYFLKMHIEFWNVFSNFEFQLCSNYDELCSNCHGFVQILKFIVCICVKLKATTEGGVQAVVGVGSATSFWIFGKQKICGGLQNSSNSSRIHVKWWWFRGWWTNRWCGAMWCDDEARMEMDGATHFFFLTKQQTCWKYKK